MHESDYPPSHPIPVISPIDAAQRRQVLACTEDYRRRAVDEFGLSPAPVTVRFDLRGRAAGLYRVEGTERVIRYNPWLFAKYFEDSLGSTVPHEVAHYVVDVLYGLRSVRPHGGEWRRVMRFFGAEPRACGDYDLSGIPVRRQRRFSYACRCERHELTTVRHRRVQMRQMRYVCRRCRTELVYLGRPLSV